MSESNYDKLFLRNWPVINRDLQNVIKNLRVLVAGCGSTGGAFIEGASRLGIIQYRLVEPDHYELHNLNRQFVYPDSIGVNKAIAQARRLESLFRGCDSIIQVNTEGITTQNLQHIISDIDLVFDAVDVTTASGLQAKIQLHEACSHKNLTVISALDLGYKQLINIYTPKNPFKLQNKYDLRKNHPLKILFSEFCRIEDMSLEILHEILRLIKPDQSGACQLASSCHLLAAYVAPIIVRYCENKQLPEKIELDLMRSLETAEELKFSNAKKSELLNIVRQHLDQLA